MKIVLLGPPGSGKGTQGKRLAEYYSLNWISSGNIFREEIEAKTDLSIRFQAVVAQGGFVPNDIVNEVILPRVRDLDHFVLDGYPRNLVQSQALVEFLALLGKSLDYVIEMVVPEHEVTKRLADRLYCKKCSSVYRYSNHGNKVCKKCDSPLFHRQDDQEHIIRERLKLYNRYSVPMLHYFQALGLLRKVNSSGNIETVFDNLKQILGER